MISLDKVRTIEIKTSEGWQVADFGQVEPGDLVRYYDKDENGKKVTKGPFKATSHAMFESEQTHVS